MYTSLLLYLFPSPISPTLLPPRSLFLFFPLPLSSSSSFSLPLLPPPSLFLFFLLPLSSSSSSSLSLPLLPPLSLFLLLLLPLLLCLLSHKLMWSVASDNIPLICVIKVTFVSLTIIACKYYIHV